MTAAWALEQEVRRVGGDYAQVLTGAVDTPRKEATGEAWLHGRFGYVLRRAGCAAPQEVPARLVR